ncbi:MAG: hypothetical protein GWN87_30535 [Desulfuromonadales bacterium]|nr:hypothetical protein [Desulfuromonadales bacterium]NIS43903.1 hypothetical protein [Desulfuromonadales bacterium]
MYRFQYLVLATVLFVSACGGGYKSQEVPFRPPAAYTSMKVVAGAQIAAQGYAEPSEARQLFGFDIRKAGLLPVQVIIDNAGDDSLEINPQQTFLIDAEGNYWNLLDNRTAYRRVSESTEFGNVTDRAGRNAFWGALGGAVVGGAIAIVGGSNVGEAMGKGAVVGGSLGTVTGGAEALQSPEAEYQISRDLGTKALANRPIRPGELGRGFLFFPGEASSASQLRLQVEAIRAGKLYTLIVDL